jgi:hypothetical protein
MDSRSSEGAQVSLEHDELQDVDEDDRKEEGFLLLKGTVCNNEFLLDSANMQPLWCCPMQEQETCSVEGTGNETVQELPSFVGNLCAPSEDLEFILPRLEDRPDRLPNFKFISGRCSTWSPSHSTTSFLSTPTLAPSFS